MASICVFCGSNQGDRKIYRQSADQVGRMLATRGDRLVYGGGSVGLMGVMADVCLAEGVEVIGIIPDYLNEKEIAHPGLSRLIVVEDMFERKFEMDRLSDAFLVLPGGFGTLDEFFEVVTLKQLKRHFKPIVVLNLEGFFDPLLRQNEYCVQEGFIKPLHLDLFQTVETVGQAFQLFDAAGIKSG